MYSEIREKIKALTEGRDKERAALDKEREELTAQLEELQSEQAAAVDAGKQEAYLKLEGSKAYIKSRLNILERKIEALDAGTGETGPAAEAVKEIEALQRKAWNESTAKIKELIAELQSVRAEAAARIYEGDALKDSLYINLIKEPERVAGQIRKTYTGAVILKRGEGLIASYKNAISALLKQL